MKNSARIGVFVIAVLPGASLASAADWPQWLGPARNGTSPDTVAVWASPPAARWRQAVGNGYSSPIVADGAVVVHAAVAGQEAEEVRALDVKTGDELWSDVYERSAYRSQLGVGPRATPTAAGGKLFTYGITGVLSCYELKGGRRLWQANPYETFKATLPQFGVCSSPVVVDGRVVVMVGGGAAAVAYDAATGQVAWKALDEPASSASPIVFVRAAGEARQADVVVQTTLRTVGLSPHDGSLRWEHPLVFQPSGVSPTPLALGHTLVCTTQDTGTLAFDFRGAAGAAPTNPWWKQDLKSYFSTGTIGPKGSVLVVTNQVMPLPRTDLRCLDLATGNELWRKDGLGYFHIAPIVLGDGKLLILDDGGHLVLAEVTRDDFGLLARSSVSRGTLASPALANGCVYIRDDKELICVSLESAAATSSTGP